ncbi:hypothetical protein ABES02_20490 [Neobacillus pocheonensis]
MSDKNGTNNENKKKKSSKSDQGYQPSKAIKSQGCGCGKKTSK